MGWKRITVFKVTLRMINDGLKDFKQAHRTGNKTGQSLDRWETSSYQLTIPGAILRIYMI